MDAVLDSVIEVVPDRLTKLDAALMPKPTVVSIDTMDPEPFDVIQPIQAVVRFEDGDFIASFIDANVHASGDTQLEAVENLKDLLVADFELYECTPDDGLGKAMQKNKRALFSCLKRRA